MKPLVREHAGYALSLLGYTALAYLYFVEGHFLFALLFWLAFLGVKMAIKPWREQSPLLIVVGLSFIFMHFVERLFPMLRWPFDFYLGALFGFLVLRIMNRKPEAPLKWSFSFSKAEIASLFLINIPAIAVLYWYFQMNPDVAKQWPLPEIPVWGIPIFIIVVAAINGLREEIFYRGLLQPASSKNSPAWFVITLQAVLFGLLHFYNAFPQGWVGVVLTGIWGAAIAIQYRVFKSISLAWVTHSVADAIMFTLIVLARP